MAQILMWQGTEITFRKMQLLRKDRGIFRQFIANLTFFLNKIVDTSVQKNV